MPCRCCGAAAPKGAPWARGGGHAPSLWPRPPPISHAHIPHKPRPFPWPRPRALSRRRPPSRGQWAGLRPGSTQSPVSPRRPPPKGRLPIGRRAPRGPAPLPAPPLRACSRRRSEPGPCAMAAAAGRSLPLLLCRRAALASPAAPAASSSSSSSCCFPALARRRQQQRHRTVSGAGAGAAGLCPSGAPGAAAGRLRAPGSGGFSSGDGAGGAVPSPARQCPALPGLAAPRPRRQAPPRGRQVAPRQPPGGTGPERTRGPPKNTE